MPPKLFLIDAIGPFFRGYGKRRINWSKIPFPHLATEGEAREQQWAQIRADIRRFANEVTALGFNAASLDDLAHLASHPLHEPEVASRIAVYREEFACIIDILREAGLKVFLTSDILPTTPAIDAQLGKDRKLLDDYYCGLVSQIFDDFPRIHGLILRLGESDGLDVSDPIRTRLHLRTAKETHAMLHRLLPIAEARERTLILRTWTVGAHRVGDLIWHRDTLAKVLDGIDSPHFIVSMKYGESDFFRHLPLNPAFFRVKQRTMIEFQARREYEGAGEIPAPIAADCERFARELAGCTNLAGVSVWCQTGGWHRFRRLAFLEEAGDDTWIRLNTMLIIGIFRDGLSSGEILRRAWGRERGEKIDEFLRLADTVISDLHYLDEFARRKLFFRRVRIPPLLHIYWDCVFINHAVAKVLRHFTRDPETALRHGEAAFALFPRMLALAREARLPEEDVVHWRDFCQLLVLARRYYLLPWDPALAGEIRAAKAAYKEAWPKSRRRRFRIKLSFAPFHVKRRTIGWLSGLLLRPQRGYRVLDHLFTLHLLSFAYRLFKPRNQKHMPKFLRKSAMGIDAVLK